MKPVYFKDEELVLIDQRKLPEKLEYVKLNQYQDVINAIKTMVVRGAPAIGVSAGYAVYLAGCNLADSDHFIEDLLAACEEIRRARPTAVNLMWAVDRMIGVIEAEKDDPEHLPEKLLREANLICEEDIYMCRCIGKYGSQLIHHGDTILTHCNAGALATADYGTALGVIRAAHEAGKNIQVYADETRPLLQGARLTAWELTQDEIPVTLITDNMAGMMMKEGKIDAVVVGADRIAANGDTANKIGTYSVAVLSQFHQIPFYIAAPSSTIDMKTGDGDGIVIEYRDDEELRSFQGVMSAPKDVKVENPAFDVTPHALIAAIITEKGVVYPPFDINLKRLFSHETE